MYLSSPARDMLFRLAENGNVDYRRLHTRELLAILELERKGLITEAPNAECKPGDGDKQRGDRNKKAIYAELRLRFIPYLRFSLAALFFALAALLFSSPYFFFLGKLPLG